MNSFTVDTAHRLCFYTVKSSKPSFDHLTLLNLVKYYPMLGKTAEGNDCGLNNSPQAISESFDYLEVHIIFSDTRSLVNNDTLVISFLNSILIATIVAYLNL